jgi:transposase
MAGPAELVTCDQTIERCVNRLKQWRAVATRYDKRAANYCAGVVLASLLLWLA